jgi:hypothetical protein
MNGLVYILDTCFVCILLFLFFIKWRNTSWSIALYSYILFVLGDLYTSLWIIYFFHTNFLFRSRYVPGVIGKYRKILSIGLSFVENVISTLALLSNILLIEENVCFWTDCYLNGLACIKEDKSWSEIWSNDLDEGQMTCPVRVHHLLVQWQ